MYKTCLCLIAVLGVACAANLGYLPRQMQQQSLPQVQPQGQAYYYKAPSVSTMAALRRIIQGHLQRFQLADRQRLLLWQAKPEVQLQSLQRQPAVAATQQSLDYGVPPNTPTPKNYAMNFLPDGKDVAPGTSYIPLKLLRIRR
ncbi:uncharacterized protein [Drosophila virilis]|uniref:Uncharacterized protein n=1 Tax=Drosophila virilis TaxID=7244 RepID=B4M5W0_DROVI|nr:uncharacterized protein LOC6632921 [Drosophila virilis]EDW59036.1 uncharacterized protein Dvir_GJ10505 [Drosophila virilis]